MDDSAPTTKLDSGLIDLAAEIVSAYVSNNSIQSADLPSLIAAVHAAISNVGNPAALEPVKGEPAVPIKKSVTPDHIISPLTPIVGKKPPPYSRISPRPNLHSDRAGFSPLSDFFEEL